MFTHGLTRTEIAPASMPGARVRPHRRTPAEQRYAGPLLAPAPVREEAGISIPPYGTFVAKYASKEWSEIAEAFGPHGRQSQQLFGSLAEALKDSRIPIDHLMRTEGATPSCVAWHVHALGRDMSRRLVIEGARHGATQDGLRTAIQDTWVPGTMRLRHVASAIRDVERTTPAEADRLWQSVKSNEVGRSLASGVFNYFGNFRAPVRPDVLAHSLSIINHRDAIWSVAAAEARGRDVWSERSLLLAINEGFEAGGGKLYRSRHGHLLGGLPIDHPGGYACNGPEDVVRIASMSIREGQADGMHGRAKNISDAQTAHRLALGVLAPPLSEPAAPEPPPAVARAALEAVVQTRNGKSVDPQVMTWLLEQDLVARSLGGGPAEARWHFLTEPGREFWRPSEPDSARA